MRALIVEDEKRLAEALGQIFLKNKITTDISNDGISGLDYALSGVYDVIILDIMLPGKNGLEVLREIRKNKLATPGLLLTAKSQVTDKVSGLDCGADDYLTKPFSTDELMARVRALMRRKDDIIYDRALHAGDLTLNMETYEMSCASRALKLGLKEFNVLQLLMENKGRVISKETLIEKVWGFDSDAEYNNVEVYISFLRKKLNHINSSVCIKAVRGVGYSLEAGK